MSKLQVYTIRLKLHKIASRIARSARYIIFKLYSSFSYKKEFCETLENIRSLLLNLEWKLLMSRFSQTFYGN
ncbi:transposase [Schnuerera ultunensis]|uniref:transposase n=1 Tax=Schnuerera ultunensis TaxID=45497 RepID=UPI003C784031